MKNQSFISARKEAACLIVKAIGMHLVWIRIEAKPKENSICKLDLD